MQEGRVTPLGPSKNKNTKDIFIIDLKPSEVNTKATDFRGLIQLYLQAVLHWSGSCPECGVFFHRHSGYYRKTPFGGLEFRIQRVICPECSSTHALIPCFIFPYNQVLAHVKQAAMEGLCYETHTCEQLAEFCGVEPSTIWRWWKCFQAISQSLLKWLARELAKTTSYTDWTRGDYSTGQLRVQKIFSLLGLYRDTFYPDFSHDIFCLLCLKKPLLFCQAYR